MSLVGSACATPRLLVALHRYSPLSLGATRRSPSTPGVRGARRAAGVWGAEGLGEKIGNDQSLKILLIF